MNTKLLPRSPTGLYHEPFDETAFVSDGNRDNLIPVPIYLQRDMYYLKHFINIFGVTANSKHILAYSQNRLFRQRVRYIADRMIVCMDSAFIAAFLYGVDFHWVITIDLAL